MNFHVIRDMILETVVEPTVTVHTENNIKRERKGGTVAIFTEPEGKTYRISFLKR